MSKKTWWVVCIAGAVLVLIIGLIILDVQSARRRTKREIYVPAESNIVKMTATIYGVRRKEDIRPLGPVGIPRRYVGTIIRFFDNGQYSTSKGCLTDWDFALGELKVVTGDGATTRIEWCDKDSQNVFAFAVNDAPCSRKKWLAQAGLTDGFLLCQIVNEIHKQEEMGTPSKKLEELLNVLKDGQPAAK